MRPTQTQNNFRQTLGPSPYRAGRSQSHHILTRADFDSAAGKKLRQLGIGPNDGSINGVHLPLTAADRIAQFPNTTLHNDSHTNAYRDYVRRAILDPTVNTREKAIQVLAGLRRELNTGRLRLNRQ
ncbi:MAG: AHH domain-containing protein [Leptospirales bacterium]|nr:AHH domain-containing protein [Leptospirales bacterium]